MTDVETLTLTPDDPRDLALRRAPRIREEEVRQIADELLIEGGRPTVERVRARLGRGSPNTVALYLDRWWTLLGARLRDLPGQELPGVPENVSRALASLWGSAIDEARSLLRDSLATQAAEIEIQRQALIGRTSDFERAQQEFHRERAALEQTVTIVQTQLGQANDRHQADRARLKDLQDECVRLVEQHERARGDATDMAARLDAARIEHQEALRLVQERSEATERHWMKQVDEVRQALARERTRAEGLEQQRLTEIGRLTSELQATQAERATLQCSLASAQEQLASARAASARLDEVVHALRERAEEAAKQLEAQFAHALTREQFENHLREVLTHALTKNAARRRFGPGDKSGR